MIILTRDEEIQLLNYVLANGYDIENGSSRAAYEFTYEGKTYVLKVFLDKAGSLQTENEVDAFKNYNENKLFANIYAVGRNCYVTEYIDEIESFLRDCVESYSDYEYYRDECIKDGYAEEDIVSEESYNQLTDLHECLDNTLGETDDNCQLGWSHKQQLYVAYDYGYLSCYDFSEQVGHMDDYINDYGWAGILEEALRMVEEAACFTDYYGEPDKEDCESEEE